MYIDALLLVSNAQAVTATALATDKIDFGAVTPRREIGTGEAMGFGVQISVAADFTTGDETYQFDIVQDEDAAFGSVVVIASFVRTAAQLALGSLHWLPLPQGFPTERFLSLRYTTGGTTPTVTIGKAWLTSHALFSIAAKSYAKGYVIS
jgi:hypothetical protein